MKKIILMSSILFSIFSFTKLNQQEIDFQQGTWQEILENAKGKNQLIFVDCYATWCGPCKMMQQKVFTDSSISVFFNEKFINYQLNMETPEGKLFIKKYPIIGYPTMFFMNTKGDVVHRIEGKHTTTQLMREAKKALQKAEKM